VVRSSGPLRGGHRNADVFFYKKSGEVLCRDKVQAFDDVICAARTKSSARTKSWRCGVDWTKSWRLDFVPALRFVVYRWCGKKLFSLHANWKKLIIFFHF
jgi:hypothetical protein